MSKCCQTPRTKPPTNARKIREVLTWILPGAALALVPKCPMCLAAYVTLWTGLGLSLSTATYLRWVMIVLSVGSIFFLAVNRLKRIATHFIHPKRRPNHAT